MIVNELWLDMNEEKTVKKSQSRQLTHMISYQIRRRSGFYLEWWTKKKGRRTCKSLPIMRLTALLPPPPTPTTFILADSMGAKEQLTLPCFDDDSLLLWEKRHSCFWNDVENEGDDVLGFASWSWSVAISVFLIANIFGLWENKRRVRDKKRFYLGFFKFYKYFTFFSC